jgi:hypothetical protein
VVALAGVRLGRSRYGLGNRLHRPGSAGLSCIPDNPGSTSLVLRETAALMPWRSGSPLGHTELG